MKMLQQPILWKEKHPFGTVSNCLRFWRIKMGKQGVESIDEINYLSIWQKDGDVQSNIGLSQIEAWAMPNFEPNRCPSQFET